MSINAKTKHVLSVIAAIEASSTAVTRDAIMTKSGASSAAVTNSLKTLTGNGLIETDDNGHITTTPDAITHIALTPAGRAPRVGTKMDIARNLMAKYNDKGRQFVLSKFRSEVDLTDKGASTYYQTLSREARRNVVAAQAAREKGISHAKTATRQPAPEVENHAAM